VIVCTSTSEYKKLILKINKTISPKTLITDVGSSKIESSKIIKKFLKRGINWIRSHPIAGSEVSGPEFGKADMFEDKWCVLIKDKKTSSKNLKFLISFWKKMGSKTVIMNSEKHDKVFSITSHLPHLIAYNLVKSAQDFEKILKFGLIKYSAGGLRDFSITLLNSSLSFLLKISTILPPKIYPAAPPKITEISFVAPEPILEPTYPPTAAPII